MQFPTLLAALLCFVAAASPMPTSTQPLIRLPYATLMGSTSLENNLTMYRRIPYASPPERFRAPKPPQSIAGIYDTDRTFDMCPQRTNSGSEDCLYLSVYSRPWELGQKKRPVMVHFYGGGFIQGDANLRVPIPQVYPVLNLTDADGFVAVYANYRVNAFGFLPGGRVKQGADLNVG
jgi:carboxylesterase type B